MESYDQLKRFPKGHADKDEGESSEAEWGREIWELEKPLVERSKKTSPTIRKTYSVQPVSIIYSY